MPIWQLCANLLIPNCLRSNLSYSPLAALELYVNKTVSACFHYKDFKKEYNEIERLISEQWLHYYNLGIKCGELRGNVSPEVVISMFRSLYYGDSFCLSITNDGLDIDALREKHILLYNAIK